MTKSIISVDEYPEFRGVTKTILKYDKLGLTASFLKQRQAVISVYVRR
jgi:hypothetical protein